MNKTERCAPDRDRTAGGGIRLSLDRDPEADHRIANSLAFLSAMLRFESRRIGTVEDGRRALIGAASRLRAMSKLHLALARSADGRVNLSETLAEMSGYVSESLGIELDCDCVDVEVPAQLAGDVALVVNEFATNAMKHAQVEGPVIVRVSISGGERLVMRIGDNGAGLPEGFDIETTDGLGMTIIQSTLARHDGSIEVIRGARGAQFLVEFDV